MFIFFAIMASFGSSRFSCCPGFNYCNQSSFHFQGPNSIMIALVMLLNIGLAILFVHFLT